MAKNYTICILLNKDLSKTLLIKKAEAKLFGGKYNGLGGKIEAGETPAQACVREVFEESNELITLKNPTHMATLTFPYENPIYLHAFYDVIDEVQIPQNREGTPQWLPVEFLLDFNNESVVGNGNMAYFCRLALLTERQMSTAGKEATMSWKVCDIFCFKSNWEALFFVLQLFFYLFQNMSLSKIKIDNS